MCEIHATGDCAPLALQSPPRWATGAGGIGTSATLLRCVGIESGFEWVLFTVASRILWRADALQTACGDADASGDPGVSVRWQICE